MKVEIEAAPSYGMAVVTLDRGETLIAESGSMVAMRGDLAVDTTFNGVGDGGWVDWLQAAFTGLVRRWLGGETLFVNEFTAGRDGDEVMIAPALVGDVRHVVLDGARKLTVQAGSYLGSSKGVSVDLIWGGFSMLFAGEGAFFLACRGEGDVLINAYGAIEEVEIDGAYRVDGGHVVAFEGDLTYSLKRVGGLKATLLSGEGVVLELTGKGTVWLQTRNLSTFIGWIRAYLPG